jgi:hypothetical protein
VTRRSIGLAAAALLGASCGGLNRLDEYEFRQRTLAVEADFPPYAEVLTGPYLPGHPRDPIHAIVRAGTRLAREIEAHHVQPRLDSATAEADLPGLMRERLGRRASRILGTRLIDGAEEADLIFEVRVRDYGIDAKDWNGAAHFYVDAEVWLLDGGDRRPIWKTRVRERDPITSAIFGPRSALRDVVTAAALADLSVDDIARALDQLAAYAADHITDRLRQALDDARH